MEIYTQLAESAPPDGCNVQLAVTKHRLSGIGINTYSCPRYRWLRVCTSPGLGSGTCTAVAGSQVKIRYNRSSQL